MVVDIVLLRMLVFLSCFFTALLVNRSMKSTTVRIARLIFLGQANAK